MAGHSAVSIANDYRERLNDLQNRLYQTDLEDLPDLAIQLDTLIEMMIADIAFLEYQLQTRR